MPRGGAVLARCDEAGRALAASSSAAASWCGWGRDTSRARIAALTVTFMLGMLPPRPVSHAPPFGPAPPPKARQHDHLILFINAVNGLT